MALKQGIRNALHTAVTSLATIVFVVGWMMAAVAATTATVCLLDSTGSGIPGATASYYAGGWQTIGTTAADGCISTDAAMAAGNRTFRLSFNGQTQQKTQNTTVDPLVIFQTLAVTAQLLDSTGTGIPGAPVTYYASGWKTLGTTDASGTTTGELLGANIGFRVTLNGQTQQKTQNTTVDPLIQYQTGAVLQGVGPRVLRYYASGWKNFVEGVELLPVSLTFDLDTGPNQVHLPIAGTSIYVPTAPTPPLVTAGPDQNIDESQSVTIDASFTDQEANQTHTATIDWGDGSTIEIPAMQQVDGLAGTITSAHTYVDDGLYTVEICVTDDGNPDAVGCGDLEVLVDNVAPGVTITGIPGSVVEGTAVTLGSTVTDPGVNDVVTLTWAVTNEGIEVASGAGADFSFTPANDGIYQVTVTADDGDTGIATNQTDITVEPAPQPEPKQTASEPDPPEVQESATDESESSPEPASTVETLSPAVEVTDDVPVDTPDTTDSATPTQNTTPVAAPAESDIPSTEPLSPLVLIVAALVATGFSMAFWLITSRKR